MICFSTETNDGTKSCQNDTMAHNIPLISDFYGRAISGRIARRTSGPLCNKCPRPSDQGPKKGLRRKGRRAVLLDHAGVQLGYAGGCQLSATVPAAERANLAAVRVRAAASLRQALKAGGLAWHIS